MIATLSISSVVAVRCTEFYMAKPVMSPRGGMFGGYGSHKWSNRHEDVYVMASIPPMVAHQRLPHAGMPKMEATTGMLDAKVIQEDNFHCEACYLAKSNKIVSRARQEMAEKAGHFILADVQRLTPLGIGGVKYAIIVADDATGCRFTLNLKKKSETSRQLIEFVEGINNKRGSYLREVRLDNAREYNDFLTFCNASSIDIQASAPYMHEQNGLAEQSGQYIVQTTRAIVIGANAPEYLWPEAIDTACYITNRMKGPNNQEKSPMQQWQEDMKERTHCTSLAHLRTWYCRTYINVPPERRHIPEMITRLTAEEAHLTRFLEDANRLESSGDEMEVEENLTFE